MEGFLNKKGGSAESTFGRRNWKRRWFELEGSELKYFEGFDKDNDEAVGLKGTIDCLGCNVEIMNHRERKFVFAVHHLGENPFILSADDEKTMKMWTKALEAASTGASRGFDYRPQYELLGLDIDENPDLATVNKAYRKAALRVHPDKGGDITEFKKIQEAFNLISLKIEEEEKEEGMEEITYEAVIQKGGKGVGFGMIVVDEPKKGYIYIKEVLPTMKLISLSDESEGEMKKGDILVMVNKDDVSVWPLSRVVQRLNDFRVPVDTDVKLTFLRRVLRSGSAVPENDDEFDFGADNYAPNNEADEPDGKQNDAAGDINPSPVKVPTSSSSSDRNTSSVAKENAAMIDSLYEQLHAAQDQLRISNEANAQINKKLVDAVQEVEALRSRVTKLEADLSASEKREGALKSQIAHLVVFSDVSKERMAKVRSETEELAERIASGQQIASGSEEIERDLEAQGLTAQASQASPQHAALRQAQLAAAAVDPSGKLLHKWAASGNPATAKLMRLESRLNQLPVGQSPSDRPVFDERSPSKAPLSSSGGGWAKVKANFGSPELSASSPQPSTTLNKAASAFARSPSGKGYMGHTVASSKGPKSFGTLGAKA